MARDVSQVPRVPAGSPEGGEWTAGGAAQRIADARDGRKHLADMFARVVQPDGGFTYQPFLDDEPKDGFALSIHPERSFAKDLKDLTFDDFVGYAMRNRDLLSKGENYIGGWHDPASGKVFLDVSRVTHSRAEAARLAHAHDQIAYFDLGKGESVTVNSRATSGGVAGRPNG